VLDLGILSPLSWPFSFSFFQILYILVLHELRLARAMAFFTSPFFLLTWWGVFG
jgi:hypothetical protein